MNCDVLIVGAGFAGLVMAERLSSIGKRCVIVDKRLHIGGNCYDFYDAAGVLTHLYGPHLFHTNSDRVFTYLSQFTSWISSEYKYLSCANGKLWSFPINLNTFEQLIGAPSTPEEMEKYLASVRVPIAHPKNSEEAIVSQVGWALYEMFYKGYTTKMWDIDPKDLDASVCLRLPIRATRNDLYFNDKHQCMPASGYTNMFYNILPLDAELILGLEYAEAVRSIRYKHLVYTGPIDQFFGYLLGNLPYRSLRFERESFGPGELKNGFWQQAVAVNYPNDYDFLRITEIKHATGQVCQNSTIEKMYPDSTGEPYYPVPTPSAALLYAQYKHMAEKCANVTFIGRLARYQYLNMDQVVAQALSAFEKLRRVL